MVFLLVELMEGRLVELWAICKVALLEQLLVSYSAVLKDSKLAMKSVVEWAALMVYLLVELMAALLVELKVFHKVELTEH
jgi:hypothetical protein